MKKSKNKTPAGGGGTRPSKKKTRAGSKAKTTRASRTRTEKAAKQYARAVLGALSPKKNAGGVGVALVLAEGQRGAWTLRGGAVRAIHDGTDAHRPKLARQSTAARRQRLASMLAGAGHVQRLSILTTLLDEPATYQTLQKTTQLKAGPLYHHVHQLRSASLIAAKERDLYRITKRGRNLMLVLLAAYPLLSDAHIV